MIKGFSNLITLLRFFLACILNFYILNNQGRVLVPIIISCIIFLTDFLDGRIARISGNTTSFGAVFDASADLFYIAVSYGTLIYLQIAPPWFLMVIIFNFAEFAITSVLLNKHSKGEAIFVFDFIGRIAAALFYITPLFIYISCRLSSPVYHFSSGVFIYGVTATAFVSAIYRIRKCVTVVKLLSHAYNYKYFFRIGGIKMLREIKEEKIFSMKEINEIQVNMTTESVHIIETKESSEIKIRYYGTAMQDIGISSEIDNRTLVVRAQRTNKLPLYEKLVLDVYIPKEYSKNLSINASSGNIKVDSFDLSSFALCTSTGKLKNEKLNAGRVYINSASGVIYIHKVDTRELEIKGNSSVISIDECIAKESRIETSSGNITLNNCSGSFNLKSCSGNVQVSYKEFEDQNTSIATTSGRIALLLPDTAEFLLEANTSTGKLKSDFAVNTIESKRMAGQVGLKSNQVVIKSLSGSISIMKKQAFLA